MSDFILPDIGEGIVECELVNWLVSEGDLIEEDQPVAEVMTDKAMVEIPAPYKGRVTRLYWKEGDIAKVHAPLFELVDESGEAPDASPAPEESPQNAHQEAPSVAEKAAAEAPSEPAPPSAASPHRRIPASPAVRRLVREYDLTLASIAGSGKDGRVLKSDVLAYLDQPATTPAAEKTAAGTAPSGLGDGGSDNVRVEPIKGMQAVMAKRMVESASTIPHFNFSEEIDVTALMNLRQQLKPDAEARGTRLTLMPFIMKAMALAIRDYPVLNSQLNADATEVHYQPECNIGMAVDSDAGLMVPNVKRVNRLTLLEIADEVTRLTTAAREGRVSQADLKGGTISISNIGALGGTYAAPIINAPEVAIVALGRTQQLPRFDADGQVVARSIMTISWAGDHRIIDGGTIARFNRQWQGYLESPQSMLLELG